MIKNLNFSIDQLLTYPGCTGKEFNIRKSMWMATVGGFLYVCILQAGFFIFIPEFTVLNSYSACLLCIMAFSMVISPKFKRKFNLYYTFHSVMMILATFYFMVKLGGITSSGGLVTVALVFVLLSMLMEDSGLTLFLFSLFGILVIVTGIFNPFLKVHEQLTPGINLGLSIINTFFMSGFAIFFVLQFNLQQKRLEELETNRMKEMNEIKTRLYTNITHEFRTPLTVIRGMADLINKEPGEWVAEGTENIRRNSDILLNLVNQMLDMARIESGSMPVRMTQGNITSYLGYVTGLFRSVAQTRNVSLDFRSDNQLFRMDFDPDLLLHILSNLISNALKFTPEGGSITISAARDEKEEVFTIAVSDTGIGIDPEQLPRIFDRFYQAGNNPSGGSGLGLAMTRELVTLLKGTLTAESRPGIGTEFSVQLPVTREAPFRESPETELDKERIKPVLSFHGSSKKQEVIADPDHSENPVLLIVEDSGDVSRYLAALLKKEYHIIQAENGRQGLEKALETVPDIILSDVMMPEMDGISLLEKVKNDIRTSHIPVVLLTAKADAPSRITGLDRGADAYLTKPFDEKELRLVIRNLIELRKRYHERYRSPGISLPESDPEFKNEDAFMTRVRELFEENLEDDEFGILQLCRELTISRTQLYRKFKSISNTTLGEYFKKLRLYKAKSLLMTTEMNVTEAAYSTGFKNLSHFSREFTREFGKSPVEFKH